MKRRIFGSLAIAAAVALGACTPMQLQNAQSKAQKLQTDITLACNVVQPAIAPWAPFFAGNAAVAAFNTDVALVCAANGALDFTSLQRVIDSSAGAAQAAVAALPNLTPQQVALVQGIIGAFQGSLKNALLAYKAGTAATAAPASAASAVGT